MPTIQARRIYNPIVLAIARYGERFFSLMASSLLMAIPLSRIKSAALAVSRFALKPERFQEAALSLIH